MINLLSKTDDFIKDNKLVNKANDFKIKIHLLSSTDDFVKSEKIKVFPMVCSKYLSSWTGLGRSGHVRFQTFGPICHVSGPKMVF